MTHIRSLLACLLVSCTLLAQTPRVQTGIEVLRGQNFEILRGKRIGLITNPTGVDATLKSTIDILYEAKNVRLTAIFGPEHGARGNYSAGDSVESSTDTQTKLPVFSLYGKTRKPTAAMLSNIDALVYDIQDIGVRSYTFISTMGLAMEAAAENNIEFVVLDRPNPLGGVKIEGNIVEKGFQSFVSRHPIPYVYGLTCGELATMLNEEGMLTDGRRCRLTVVPMKGWTRGMTFEQTGLPWVPASPNIPEGTSPQYYAATGILGELGVISEGVGYTLPFHLVGAEWIDPKLLADRMNALKLTGVLFRPIVFKPFGGRLKDKQVKGVQIHITDGTALNLMSLQFLLMQVHQELYPDRNPFSLAESSRLAMFDKVMGTDQVRKLFTKRMRYEDIEGYLNKDIGAFRKNSGRYYRYR